MCVFSVCGSVRRTWEDLMGYADAIEAETSIVDEVDSRTFFYSETPTAGVAGAPPIR